MKNAIAPSLTELLAKVNFDQAIDITIPLDFKGLNPNAYYAEAAREEVIRMGNFVGSVAEGGAVNYAKISITPHGNGTHTECYGHISADPEATIGKANKFLFTAFVVEIEARKQGNDLVILLSDLQNALGNNKPEALIIKTLPNSDDKLTKAYSGTNPIYPEPGIGAWLANMGFEHWVLDLPSVDREEDGGKLANHHGFWQYPHATRKDAIITELAFIPENVKPGWYVLQWSACRWKTDAAPARLVIYPLR